MKVAIPHFFPGLIRQPWTTLEPLTWNLTTDCFPASGLLICNIHHIFSVELSRPGFGSENTSRKGGYSNSQLHSVGENELDASNGDRMHHNAPILNKICDSKTNSKTRTCAPKKYTLKNSSEACGTLGGP